MSLKERILLRMFGRPEGVLGRLGGISLARADRKFAQEVVSLLHVQPFDHVLEVGSGAGVGIELLARAARKGEVARIDFSEVMVRQATGNAAAIRSGLVDLRLGTVESMPFEDDAFDTVLAINSMQVWPDVHAGREIPSGPPSAAPISA